MDEGYNEIDRARLVGEEMLSSSNITAMTVLLSVLKRPWILILTFLVVMIPLVVWLYSMVPRYISSAMVMVTVQGTSFLDEVASMGDNPYKERSENYYTSILDSRAYLDSVAVQMVRRYPEMPSDSIKWAVYGGIAVENNPRNEGFLRIKAYSVEPHFALALAQSALEQFQNRCIDLERQEAVGVSRFIDEQIGHITEGLGQAEKELQHFLTTHKLTMADTETGIVGELFELEQKRSEAQAKFEMVGINIDSYNEQLNSIMDRLTLNYREVAKSESGDLKFHLAAIRDTLRRAEELGLSEERVSELREEMDRTRTDMINEINSGIGGGAAGEPSVGVTIQKLEENREAALIERTNYQNQIYYYKAQIDRFKREHPNLPDDILEYARLSRSKAVLQSTLEFMLEKRETARIRVALEQGGIKVIDEPRLPTSPIGSGKGKKLAFGIIAALGIGLLISIVTDRFDNTVKEERDIRRAIGLMVFGTIPVLSHNRFTEGLTALKAMRSRNDRGRQRLLTSFSEKSPVAEAYRSLKITLQFEARDKGLKVFVISSPSASEGKSLTTANLAISFAQGGKRTLIVDGDLRRAIQHRFSNLERKPGLTDYLFENASIDDIVRETKVENLHVIPAGTSPPNPAELLASQRMKQFIALIRSRYDIILIDSPPVTVCSDPLVMAEVADGMIFIAKVEYTNIKAIEHSVNLARRLNINVLGVILNQVELRFGLTYYYAYRYYRPYSYYGSYSYRYYDDGDEEPGPGTRKRRRRTTRETAADA